MSAQLLGDDRRWDTLSQHRVLTRPGLYADIPHVHTLIEWMDAHGQGYFRVHYSAYDAVQLQAEVICSDADTALQVRLRWC